MRKTSFVLATLLLLIAPLQADSDVRGTWVSVQRSRGGLGSILTFLPDGKVEMSVGAIVESWYEVAGDKLIQPPGTTNGKPVVTRFRVADNTLVMSADQGGTQEMRFTRVGRSKEASSIVGVWRNNNAGADPQLAEMARREYREFTRDGLIKFRLPMQTETGVYDPGNHSITLAKTSSFRLDNGLLILAGNEKSQTFVRADATKEELKRAGVRYGETPAELERPAH